MGYTSSWGTPPIVSAFGDTDGEFFGRTIFRPKNFGPSFFRRKKISADFFSAEKFSPEFFRGAVRGGRSRSIHFKKFAKANFLKWCRGGVPQESPLPVPCPPGGDLGGFAPSGIPVTRALPPQLDVRTVKNLKMSPKRRTDLKI